VADRIRLSPLSALDPAQWDALSRGRPPLRRELLLEFAGQQGYQLQVCSLSDDTGLLCAAIVEISTTATETGRLEGLLFGRGRALASRLRIAGLPYLCVAPPLGQDSGVVVRPGTATERTLRTERFVVALEQWCSTEGMGLVFLAVPEHEAPLFDVLRSRGYLRSRSRSSTVFPIRWRNFDDYRRDLAARGGRIGATLRQERKRSRDAGVAIRRVAPTAATGAKLYELALDHYRYKNGEPLSYDSSFLQNLLPALGDDVLVLEATRGGVVCAILGVVKSGIVGWACFFGLDTRDRPNDFTYFNLVYYTLMDHAADFGLDRVIMGSGVYAAKLRRGCELVPVQFFHRPHGVLRRILLRPWYALHGRWVAKKFT
jgi:predicted N-acyltransferase